MKRNIGRVIAVAMALMLLVALLPAAMADEIIAYSVKVGAVTLYDDQCMVDNEATEATDGNNDGSYVAYFKDNVLYLNGLQLSEGQIAVSRTNEIYDLTIDVSGTNSVTCSTGAAFLSDFGYVTGRGSSVTIQGSGVLNLTGKNGIWVWTTTTVRGSVTLNATGTNGSGIINNADCAILVLEGNAVVNASGTKYGVAYDNSHPRSTININGGTLTAIGSTAALRVQPTLGIGVTMQGSADVSGADPVDYVAENNATYKWVKSTYEPPVYDVVYKVDGEEVSSQDVLHGQNAVAPELPAKEGYTAAWDSDGKNITADTEINAVYTPIKYTVTYKTDGTVVSTQEVEHGKDAAAPAVPAKEGYTGAWDGDGKNITKATEINAVYTIKTYTVTYKVEGEVVSTQTIEHGKDAVAPELTAKEGYTAAWDGDGNGITTNTEINAVYTPIKYTVTYKADGNLVSTQEVEHGKDAAAPAVPAKEGYTGAWDGDGKNITVATEINAVYTIKTYTVTYKVEGEVVSTQTIEHGKDAVAPELPAKEGYNASWSANGKGITADVEITAVYTKKTSNPNTSDAFDPTLWIAVQTVSAAGLALLLPRKKK